MEKELILRLQAGDRKAFDMLYSLHGEYALRVAAAVTKNNVDAADAVQETFLKIYHNIQTFDSDRPFKPWFYRILINECNNILRKRSRTISMSDYLDNNTEASEKDTYKFEEHELLYKAINKLKDIHRIPIILKYLDDLTEKDIAEILDININTVKTRLFHGREKLKKYLEKFQERGFLHG